MTQHSAANTQHLKPGTQRIIRLILLAVLIYLTTVGATFNGVLAFTQFQPITMLLFGVVVVVWLWWHRRRGWYRTPLDGVLLLWTAAFAISILANPATTRRSVEALWYMGLYAAGWYLLSDILAQGFPRRSLVEGFLLSSIIIVAFGLLQTLNLLISGGNARPVSLIGNPNAFGAYLVVLLPFIIVPMLTMKNHFGRVMLGLYALAGLVLLVATASRGAWIGFITAIVVLVLLLLAQYGLLSYTALQKWWQTRTRMIKAAFAAGIIVLLVGAVLTGVVILLSFSASGRGADLRTYLWEAALQMFAEKPLTGQGLFTYGYHLARFDSIPPGQPHSHAHNLPLLILAELGLPGLLALLVSLVVILRVCWQNWHMLPKQGRPMWIAGAAALSGFVVHHLFDTPAMMPVIALIGLLALVIVTAPAQPAMLSVRWRQMGHPAAMLLLWMGLITAGLWHTGLYGRYYEVLKNAVENETFAEAAAELRSIIDADPYQPAYHLQQGYLYGLAASEGDNSALQPAIDAYSRYLELEPYQAAGWSNLAALYWQNGDSTAAAEAVQKARELAPAWQIFERQQQLYTGILTNTLRIEPDELESPWGANMARFQYLRDVIPAQFLPQVGW